MTDTINLWNGTGSNTNFTFNFKNYRAEYVTLNGYVRDIETKVVDPTYSWSFDPTGTQAVLDKSLEVGKQFVLEVDLNKTTEVWYANATETLNDISANKNSLQALSTAQAALDHRGNPRVESEDMNNHTIDNVASATLDHQAVNLSQLDAAVGNIDALVERAEDAADESELYRDESLAASVDSANSAAAALVSEQDAEAAADRANTMYKGEWETDYPNGTDTGYLIGDTVLYQNNQYKSIINNNQSVPTSTLGTEWLFYLPGAISSDAQAASFFQTYLQGDGVTKDFDLTAINPTWTPKIDDNVFLILINNETSLDWTIVVNNDGHSILSFLNAPAESNDTNKNNIFIVGGSPTISDIPHAADSFIVTDGSGTFSNLPKQDLPVKDFVKDKIYYGGEFDASKQFTLINNPVYDYTDHSYSLNGSNQFIVAKNCNFTGATIKLDVKFNETDFSGTVGIFSQNTNNQGLALKIVNGKSQLFLSSDGSNWDIANDFQGSYTYVNGITPIIRLLKTPTEWKLQYSLDGVVFIDDIVINSTLPLFTSSDELVIGAMVTGTDSWTNGKIFLTDVSLEVDGAQYIRPQDIIFKPNTIEWTGTVRSDDNTVDLTGTGLRVEGNAPITEVMLSNSQNGFISSASSELNAGYAAFLAFNRVEGEPSTNRWVSTGNTGWLQIQLPVAKSAKMYTVMSGNYSGANTECPANWTFEGSNTGTFTGEEVILDTQVGITSWDINETKTFYIPNNTSDYLYYRINITANVGGTYVSISDLGISETTLIKGDMLLFIGKDSTDTTVLEFANDKLGSGLVNITGAKRRIGDDKDITFPTDSSMELAPFVRSFGTWEFELWSGNAGASTITLNNSIRNYSVLYNTALEGGVQDYPGSNLVSDLVIGRSTRLVNTESYYITANIVSDVVLNITVATGGTKLTHIKGVK